jgi:ATP-binding cassette subfamily A (ABC1) protein 3
VYPGGKVAVADLSFGVPAGECFGFLGINGAGKTSTLKILTGDEGPTAGTVLVGGHNAATEPHAVRHLLGYCPQFDALLELLTVREHLELYSGLKGIPPAAVPAAVDAKLAQLDLLQYANKLAGTLSGGNKRKLSVAIALIGAPRVVVLDEPSTGMDPVARRFMWDVISRAVTGRKECSLLLTTHSMEEVEALCGRVGIMVGGRLRCLGSAQHLKSRFGSGYVCTLQLEAASPAAEQAVANRLAVVARAALAGGGPEVPAASLAAACAAAGDAGRAAQVTPTGSGWAVHASLQRQRAAVSVADFAVWWAEEDAVAAAVATVTGSLFPGSSLEERQGRQLRFAVPAAALGGSLAAAFAALEGTRARLGVASYTLGQTSLEQVFNGMAAAQREETGVARGFVGGHAQ